VRPVQVPRQPIVRYETRDLNEVWPILQLRVCDDNSLAAAVGADAILSTSNSTRSMVNSIQGSRPDGLLVSMGADAEPLSLSLIDVIAKCIRIIGSQKNGPEYLYEALDSLAQGKVRRLSRRTGWQRHRSPTIAWHKVKPGSAPFS